MDRFIGRIESKSSTFLFLFPLLDLNLGLFLSHICSCFFLLSQLGKLKNYERAKEYISLGHIVVNHLSIACFSIKFNIWCLSDKNRGQCEMVKVEIIITSWTE